MTAFRIALAALAPLIAVVGALAVNTPARACSVDADWDPVANSDVIVGGRIEGFTPLPDRTGARIFIPIRLDMRIDHVWKGSLSPGAEIVDSASFMLQPVFTDKEEIRIAWAGSGGACGAFNDDPSGQYAVFGLFAAPDGTLQTTGPRTFYLSPRPYDPATIARLSQRIALPVTGHGASERPAGSVGEALLLAGTALFVAGIALGIRSRMYRTGGQT